MNITNIHLRKLPATTLLLALNTCLTVLALCGTASGTEGSSTAARQAEVATRGAEVMPFDLEQTMHHFQSLDNGGLQTVTAPGMKLAKDLSLVDHAPALWPAGRVFAGRG